MNAQLHQIGSNFLSADAFTIQISQQSQIDFSKICRTCLQESTKKHEIRDDGIFFIRSDGSLERLRGVFESSTGMKLDSKDNLPSHICDVCLQRAKSSYSFRCQSQRANQILESLLSVMKDGDKSQPGSLKTEVEEENDAPKTQPDEIDPNSEEEISIPEREKPPVEIQQQSESDSSTEVEVSIKLNGHLPESEEEVEENHQQTTQIVNLNVLPVVDEGSLENIEQIFKEFDEEDNDTKKETSSTEDDGMVIEHLEETFEQQDEIEKQKRQRQKLFQCEFCGFGFNFQRDIIVHYRQDHPDEKPFKCDICSMAFVHIQSMRRHKNSHDIMPKKKSCPQCKRLFSRADDLRRHFRTHTDERPYGCIVCPKAFKQHTELKDHMLTHHETKMYKCEPCRKEWRSRNGWYLHMKSHREGRGGKRKRKSDQT